MEDMQPWGVIVYVDDDPPEAPPYRVCLTVRATTCVRAGEIAEEITGGSLFCLSAPEDFLRAFSSEIPPGAIADERHVFWVRSSAPKDMWKADRGFYDPAEAIEVARALAAADGHIRHVSVCARGFLSFGSGVPVRVRTWAEVYDGPPEPIYEALRAAWDVVRGDAPPL